MTAKRQHSIGSFPKLLAGHGFALVHIVLDLTSKNPADLYLF